MCASQMPGVALQHLSSHGVALQLLGSPGVALEHLSSHGDLQSRADCYVASQMPGVALQYLSSH